MLKTNFKRQQNQVWQLHVVGFLQDRCDLIKSGLACTLTQLLFPKGHLQLRRKAKQNSNHKRNVEKGFGARFLPVTRQLSTKLTKSKDVHVPVPVFSSLPLTSAGWLLLSFCVSLFVWLFVWFYPGWVPSQAACLAPEAGGILDRRGNLEREKHLRHPHN